MPKIRTGGLAVPEAFAPRPCPTLPCPSCGTLRPDHEPCPHGAPFWCFQLQCTGFGNLHSRLAHQVSCYETACDLRYLPRHFPWRRVIAASRARCDATEVRNDRCAG